jgi:hypothetical protein
MHQQVGIPQQYPLIPASRSHPATSTKQTPINTCHKLRMPVHDTHLCTRSGSWHGPLRLVGGIVPESHRHVVAGADEDVACVRAPRQSPHGVLVSRHERERPAVGIAYVECSDHTVDAAGGDDGVAVLVPVVSEDFGGRTAGGNGAAGIAGSCVNGDGGDEMVFCGGGRSEIE